MKPTSATKEAAGHSPLPWYFDELRKEVYAHDKGFVCGFDVSPYMQEHEFQVCLADAQLIVTAVNERERLREALRQTRQCITGHVCIINWSDATREIQTREAQRVVELIDVALNDATPSTSAGGG